MTWLADLVLAATAIEAVLLILFGRRLGIGIAPADALALLLPGAALALALRLALAGAAWLPIAGALLAALVFHAVDLARRGVLRRRR